MPKQYLTISEFASLRNININSLRYYEKLKILTPAWIDPATKYRYYLPDQLPVLDVITLCIKLDIPLKRLKDYVDQNGVLDEKAILEAGRELMQRKIAEMQTGLELTQFNLDSIRQNQLYCDQTGIYTREIEERFFVAEPFSGDWNSIFQKEKTAINLFHDAQAHGMAPVFPAGILINFETAPVSLSFCFQVLHPSLSDKRTVRVPKADFSCLQIDMTSQTSIYQTLKDNFPMERMKTVIISNMLSPICSWIS